MEGRREKETVNGVASRLASLLAVVVNEFSI